MKPGAKIKKLTLHKETLRDLTARHSEQIKGGAPSLTLPTGCFIYTCKCNGKTAKCATKKQGTC